MIVKLNSSLKLKLIKNISSQICVLCEKKRNLNYFCSCNYCLPGYGMFNLAKILENYKFLCGHGLLCDDCYNYLKDTTAIFSLKIEKIIIEKYRL